MTPATPPPATQPPAARPPVVLVVDDAATVRSYHTAILAGLGCTVVEAVNGYEALETALERAFDLLVVDVNMPRLDGYGFVRRLRADGPSRGAPVVMVSTEDQQQDADAAYDAGANLYQVKPVTPARLAAIVDVLVRLGAPPGTATPGTASPDASPKIAPEVTA